MKNRKGAPGVNAGSMADIAFLLLIFFLVTTSIETEQGIERMLPRTDTSPPPLTYHDRNILLVNVNQNNEIMVDEKKIDLKELRELTIAFLDNGGALSDTESYCDYCQGERSSTSSDNPVKAIVSLSTDRETSYASYITVQNELVGAYNALRNREALRLYGMKYTQMESQYLDSRSTMADRATLKVKIKSIQELFPKKYPKLKSIKHSTMIKFKIKSNGGIPPVSTASLPDIVFMLLFFFMSVTVMKDTTLKVENTLPNASEIKKMEKKDRIIYIHVGKPIGKYEKLFGKEPKIQLNDKYANVEDVGPYVLAEIAKRPETSAQVHDHIP